MTRTDPDPRRPRHRPVPGTVRGRPRVRAATPTWPPSFPPPTTPTTCRSCCELVRVDLEFAWDARRGPPARGLPRPVPGPVRRPRAGCAPSPGRSSACGRPPARTPPWPSTRTGSGSTCPTGSAPGRVDGAPGVERVHRVRGPVAGDGRAVRAPRGDRPAAGWASSTGPATRPSTATWPSRCCATGPARLPAAARRFARRGPDHRPAPAPRHPAGPRARHAARRPAVPGHEADQGPDPGRPARRTGPTRPPTAGGSWRRSSRSARRSPTPTPTGSSTGT